VKKHTNKFIYIAFVLIMIIAISFLSNYIILGNYEDIENKQNKQNILDTVTNLKKHIQNHEKTILDYASWDDTYDFIQDEYLDYIDSNFPSNGNTLENLNVDSLLFTTRKNKIIFTATKNIYINDSLKGLNTHILLLFKQKEKITTIIKFNKKLFIIIKKPILKSDSSGNIKGFLYGVVELNQNIFKDISRDFDNFIILKSDLYNNPKLPCLAGFYSNIIKKEKHFLENKLSFYNKSQKHIFSLKLKNKRELYQQAKTIVIYFNILSTLFLIIFIFILYTIQKIQNEKLTYKDEVKTKFLANMSHELRTPLNAISGFSEILIEDEKNKQTLEYLHLINNQSQHMLFMINDILDFAQVEENKLKIEIKSFEIEKELQNIVSFAKFFSKKKNIDFRYEFIDLPTNVITDSVRLAQVLINIINNAIKFTKPNGKIELVIKYLKESNMIDCQINDTGIGIDKDKISTIFNRFEQIDSRTTKEFEGTGLGLSISLVIVKLLGGDGIGIQSKKGKGSTFSFSIPIEIDNVKKEIPNKQQDKIKDYNQKTILLVEDNIANQQFMSILFKKININFDIAQNGQIAVEKFKEKKYDLILMDENMPVMSGTEATKEILQIELENNLTHTPIVALTANALKEDKDKFMNAKLDDYVTKPIQKNTLLKIFNQYIK